MRKKKERVMLRLDEVLLAPSYNGELLCDLTGLPLMRFDGAGILVVSSECTIAKEAMAYWRSLEQHMMEIMKERNLDRDIDRDLGPLLQCPNRDKPLIDG